MKTFISKALRPTFGAVTRRQGLQWLATCPFLSDAQAAPTGVQLASDWSVGRSPQGFLVSEKFDGVRAVWNGRQLRFRSGREIVAPDWFVRALPQQPQDWRCGMNRKSG